MFAKKNIYFMDCHLAGRKYHDADEVWDKLKVGTIVNLVAEPDNPSDHNAIGVTFDAEDGKTYLLGYIPRSDNKLLSDFFEMGWSDIFECRISQLDPEAHPENQVQLTIKIKKRT